MIPSVIRSASFRRVVTIASAFAVAIFALFGFIYWQTALLEKDRVRDLLVNQANAIAATQADQVEWLVKNHLVQDSHRVALAALFGADGGFLLGNLDHIPAELPDDGRAHALESDGEPILAIRKALPDGRQIVIGRNIDSIAKLREAVLHALTLGVVPGIALSLILGAILAYRLELRVRVLQSLLDRFRSGELMVRLPIGAGRDEIDRLAASVNHMLDEIEALMAQLRDTGNNIAHDLRTPLTRVQALLERLARANVSDAERKDGIDRAVAGLDQVMVIINALLRIAEIESFQRYENFGSVDLADLLRELFELYEPIAEERGLHLSLRIERGLMAWGDRDLLSEAVANLLDNAVKFTPAGGEVSLSLQLDQGRPVILVVDTGPGIPPALRGQVFQRFYRADRSRNIPGSGLGLNLVSAIVKMHDFSVRIEDTAQGCAIRLVCGAA